MKPLPHAKISVKKFGGSIDGCIKIHSFINRLEDSNAFAQCCCTILCAIMCYKYEGTDVDLAPT